MNFCKIYFGRYIITFADDNKETLISNIAACAHLLDPCIQLVLAYNTYFRVSDKKAAKTYNIRNFPALSLFRNGEPSHFEVRLVIRPE